MQVGLNNNTKYSILNTHSKEDKLENSSVSKLECSLSNPSKILLVRTQNVQLHKYKIYLLRNKSALAADNSFDKAQYNSTNQNLRDLRGVKFWL